MTKEEAIKVYQEITNLTIKEAFEFFAPELKESEDEKIRKTLIDLIKCNERSGYSSFNNVNTSSMLAWLEKQGEQKLQDKPALEVWKNMRLEVYQQASGNRHEPNYSDDSTKMFSLTDIDEIFEKVAEKQCEQKETLCDKCRREQPYHSCQDIIELGRCALEHQSKQKTIDKVEPKFKAGDFVVNKFGRTKLITNIENGCYRAMNINDNTEWHGSIEYANTHFHQWTIQDANDGDVLATKDAVFIFKHMDKIGLSLCRSYCEVFGNSKLGLGFDFPINSVHPATKEQRDLLFRKMKEVGYEWDAEKKELKKIEQTNWSEEDEVYYNSIIEHLKNSITNGKPETYRSGRLTD